VVQEVDEALFNFSPPVLSVIHHVAEKTFNVTVKNPPPTQIKSVFSLFPRVPWHLSTGQWRLGAFESDLLSSAAIETLLGSQKLIDDQPRTGKPDVEILNGMMPYRVASGTPWVSFDEGDGKVL